MSVSQTVYYGPGRTVSLMAGPETTQFDGSNYVSHGRLNVTQMLQTSSGSISVSGGTYVDFNGGYYAP